MANMAHDKSAGSRFGRRDGARRVKNKDVFHQPGMGVALMASPLGDLRLSILNGCLTAIDILDSSDGQGPVPGETGLPAQGELAAYFEDGAHAFQIPLQLEGTDFQQKVWRAMREIPSGQVVTYGELARRLGTSARAVGNACRRNPCPIVVPCHRVVSAQGLGGYDGQTEGPLLERKRWLLRHEGAIGD